MLCRYSKKLLSLPNKRYLSESNLKAVLLTGSYNSEKELQLSECAKAVNMLTNGALVENAQISQIKKARTFYNLHPDLPIVTLSISSNESDASRDVGPESVRSAIGSGMAGLLADESIGSIMIDSSGQAKAAAEAAELSTYHFDASKTKKKKLPSLGQCDMIYLPEKCSAEWSEGIILGKSQNTARYLMDMPANLMTPEIFAQTVSSAVNHEDNGIANLEVIVRDEAWIRENKMGAFLSVSAGSEIPPVLLEMRYKGADGSPVVLVGKGVTFDTGGISIKPSKNMEAMRADMGGAACVASATLGAASLGLPVNLVSLMPLCENMPSGKATKPGDVVTSMSGKTIQVDNTDAEGRLILADTLTYAHTFEPKHIIDMATLTGAMAVALGGECSGVFSNDDELWSALNKAGFVSGDRVWRMPIFKEYDELLKAHTADVGNIGTTPYGGSITAAMFLKRFVECESWAHIDIAGVMDDTRSSSYLPKGMSGRPTRTIIEALKTLA